MQYLIGVRESETHPLQYSRILTIVKTFYGENLSNALRISLMHDDHENFESILNTMPNYTLQLLYNLGN